MASIRGSKARSLDAANASTASREASAAAGPCPRPSAMTSRARPASPSQKHQLSPQAVSLRMGRFTAPTRQRDARLGGYFAQTSLSKAVPIPGWECTSKTCEARWTAPRPVPGVPAVEKPSRMNAPKLAVPGPSSSARISIPMTLSFSSRRNSKAPPLAVCRSRLLASSVTTRATRETSSSSPPASCVQTRACRRASPAWLLPMTGMKREARMGEGGSFTSSE